MLRVCVEKFANRILPFSLCKTTLSNVNKSFCIAFAIDKNSFGYIIDL